MRELRMIFGFGKVEVIGNFDESCFSDKGVTKA